jgi:mercuric ion transport protein
MSHVHVNAPTTDPPTRTKVTAALAGLACAICCALPFLIAAGLLTGAGAALAQNLLLGLAGVLLAAAGFMWWLHRRRMARKAAASGCADGTCAC